MRVVTCAYTLTQIRSRVNVGNGANPLDGDFFFTLARLCDVIGRLHPHQRIHLHAKSFFDTQTNVAGQVGLGRAADG